MASVSVGVMDNPVQLQQQQQSQLQSQEALKCPRCDSSNTKFCYFNNYSLSQPRHFCKACKRYWTRGGTLRNVPVGGGCRKNKRVKRSITTTTITTTNPSSNLHVNPNPNSENLDQNHNISVSIPSSTNGSSNHHLNPLFYGLFSQNHNYPRFDTRVVSGVNPGVNADTLVSGFDFNQPQTRVSNISTGLGFSSTGAGGGHAPPAPAPSFVTHGQNSNLSNFPNYTSSLYNYHTSGSGSVLNSTLVTAPTMASLLASTLNQQPRFTRFAAEADVGTMGKDLKMEERQSYRVDWNSTNNNFHESDQTETVVSSDPNSLIWDTESGWHDRYPSNIDQSDE